MVCSILGARNVDILWIIANGQERAHELMAQTGTRIGTKAHTRHEKLHVKLQGVGRDSPPCMSGSVPCTSGLAFAWTLPRIRAAFRSERVKPI